MRGDKRLPLNIALSKPEAMAKNQTTCCSPSFYENNTLVSMFGKIAQTKKAMKPTELK
jgi:hypothetical protein